MAPKRERANLIRLSRYGFVNAYLVEEEDGLTLVDTMIGGSAPRILAAAEQLGRPITTIVLTHAHGDHVGSLDALAERLPGVEVAISASGRRDCWPAIARSTPTSRRRSCAGAGRPSPPRDARLSERTTASARCG